MLAQNIARNHQPLNLAGAFIDSRYPAIAKISREQRVAHVSGGRPYLEGTLRSFVGCLGSVNLGHSRLATERLLRFLEPGGTQGQEPCSVAFGQLRGDKCPSRGVAAWLRKSAAFLHVLKVRSQNQGNPRAATMLSMTPAKAAREVVVVEVVLEFYELSLMSVFHSSL